MQARACLFVVLFFAAVFSFPRSGVWGIPRYDALLIIALAIQGWMLWAKLETLDELKAICLFHVIGFALEVFKSKLWEGRKHTFPFDRFSGLLVFDRERPERSSVRFVVESASAQCAGDT